MAEEMAEVREEAAEVTTQRDAAEDEAQHLTTELERLQAQFDDDSAALQVSFLTHSVHDSGWCHMIASLCCSPRFPTGISVLVWIADNLLLLKQLTGAIVE